MQKHVQLCVAIAIGEEDVGSVVRIAARRPHDRAQFLVLQKAETIVFYTV